MKRLTPIALVLALVPSGALAQRRGPSAPHLPKAIEKWEKLGPAERKRKLNELPADRRAKIEKQLDSYEKMSPEERDRLQRSYDSFQQLPPDRQAETRKVYRRFSALSRERRDAVSDEFKALRALPDDQRKARMESEDFRTRYTPAEQQLLSDLTHVAEPMEF